MNRSPRFTIAASTVIASTVLAPATLHAQQKFPTKPIRLVVAFTPGGTTDILARMVTQGMSETFGQPIVIENRPAGTPRAVRRQISEELGRQLAIPEIKGRLTNMGFNVAPSAPEEHEKNMRADLEVFNRLVAEAGLKPK